MDLFSPKILDEAFCVRHTDSSLRFDLEIHDPDDPGALIRVAIKYKLRVIGFFATVVVTADGHLIRQETINDDLRLKLRKLWEGAEWHRKNYARMGEQRGMKINAEIRGM